MRRSILMIIMMSLLSGCSAKSVLRFPPARWVRDSDRTPFEQRSKAALKGEEFDKSIFQELGRSAAISNQVSDISSYVMVGGRQEALDINNFDEVPDSTWFTNRIGRFDLTPEEVAYGPEERVPPAAGNLKIITMLMTGDSPKFLVRDERGFYYILKFDPKSFPRVATGAEVIASRFLYAAGYSVPDNHLLMLDQRRLVVSDPAWTIGKYGKEYSLNDDDVKRVLKGVERGKSDNIYAVAVHIFPGRVLGPFRYDGKRSSDPNDRIPHEHRRELRGLRVFCDFLGFARTHPFGTLDTFHVVQGGDGYILHHLFDLSDALGSSDVYVTDQERRKKSGFNPMDAAAALVTVGIYDPYSIESAPVRHPALGIEDTKNYVPGKWHEMFPNPAFAYMTGRDAAWAAMILSRFSDEDIAAIVKEAGYVDPENGRYMTRALIERRDKAVRYWVSKMSPLGDFVLNRESDGYSISFDDLAINEGFSNDAETHYRQRIGSFKLAYYLGPWEVFEDKKVVISDESADQMKFGHTYRMRISVKREGEEWWCQPVDLFLKRDHEGLKLLGLIHNSRSY